jgi:molybdopterin/thiamine biosynthesis adenylyltransferase
MPSQSYTRYDRQIAVPGVGTAGQERLLHSHVLILGLGGLGTVSSTYLARAGVGRLTLVDRGKIDLPDLNRQILYAERDTGSTKTEVALRQLSQMNPHIQLTGISDTITYDILERIIRGVDIVIDGLDNIPTRLIANKICCDTGKIFVYGGISGTKGAVSTFFPGKGPCLKCLHEHDQAEKSNLPVMGPVPGVVASLQSLEAINFLTGHGLSLNGRLLMFEGRSMNFFSRKISRKPGCEHCAHIK